MSFKRASKEAKQPKLVWWPVTIQEPKDDGRAVHHKVKVQYEIIEESEKEQVIADGGDPGFLQRVIKDWKDFLEEDNSQVPCTPETVAEFIETSWIKTALVQAYFVAAVGGRRKN